MYIFWLFSHKKRVISAITPLLKGFLSLWMYPSMKKQPFFFPNPYLQGEPFAEDKEFFPNLPILPILENSTKTVQPKGSDFSIAVTPENTKKENSPRKCLKHCTSHARFFHSCYLRKCPSNCPKECLRNCTRTCP